MNKIRNIRNDCIHFNESFKKLDEVELHSNAKVVLLEYKKVLKEILEFNVLDTIEVTNKILNKNDMSFEEFKYRYRNLIKKQEGVDLQIDPSINRLVFTSYYCILEIDIDGNDYKEMTLHSAVSEIGITEEWQLLELKDVFRGRINI